MDEQYSSNFSHESRRPQPARPPEEDEPEYNPRARLDYLEAVNPPKKKRTWLRVIVGVLLLLIVGASGAYGYLKVWKPHQAVSQVATPVTKQPAGPISNEKIVTKHLDVASLKLGLDYPQNWTPTDTGDGKLTIASPATKQKTASGQEVYVRSILTITATTPNIPAFEKGSGLAVRDSEKIAYSQPTSVQRAETYLSFVQYSTTTIAGALDGIYVTGDFGYKKDQAVPRVDMAKLDPVIVVNFQTCTDKTCAATPAATSLPSTIWDSPAFKNPLLAMVKSIAVN